MSVFGLPHILGLGAIMFSLGIFAILSRRNIIGILMGIELLLNASALNFAAFSKYISGNVQGDAFAIFIIVLAAAEAVTALAILIVCFHRYQTILSDQLTSLKG